MQVIQWSDHEAGVLPSQLIGCLADVDGLKLVLFPEGEELLGHSKRSTNVVDGRWPPLRQLLQDRLHVLLWPQFFLSQALV